MDNDNRQREINYITPCSCAQGKHYGNKIAVVHGYQPQNLAKGGSYVRERKAPWDYLSQVSVSYLISFKEGFLEYLCSNFSTLPAPSLPTHALLNNLKLLV